MIPRSHGCDTWLPYLMWKKEEGKEKWVLI
jgi:hypothetical protein